MPIASLVSNDREILNGRVVRQGLPAKSFWDAYADRNQLLTNDGHGKFTDVSPGNLALCGDPMYP